ncbi:MAG: type II secretion system protein GspL [bacterium]
MIKNIFLPEFFKDKRVYSQIILGFDLQDNNVNCVKVFSGRTENRIEAVTSEQILTNNKKEHSNQAAISIKKIVQTIGRFDQVYISVPAAKVIFNEIEIPFLDIDKIRMILNYEIESMLPFSIKDSVIDFIVTKQFIENKKSQILVAAIRNEDVKEVLDIYKSAGIEPEKITIDLFAIYNLYQQIPEYRSIKNSSTIIDIGSSSTRIALLQDGQLKLTRTFNQGINTISQNIANETNQKIENIKEKIKNFGFSPTDNPEYNKILQKYAFSFFQDIQFTLNSFILKLNIDKAISKILFTGSYSKLKDLNIFCKNLLQIPCETFNTEKIFSNSHLINKTKKNIPDWNQYMVALGTSIPCIKTLYFNLRRKQFEPQLTNILTKQLKTAIIIIIFTISFLIINGLMQIRKLSNQIKEIEKTETSKLLKTLPQDFKLPKNLGFKALITKADRLISEKLEMWGPFEKQQIEPLLILQELSNIIDKKRFDVTIYSLTITEEDEIAKVELEGFYQSKTGSYHYQYFAELENRFEKSKILELWDPQEEIKTETDGDKGIIFSAKLKLKE